MYSNCRSRSGWRPPSSVLRCACRLYPLLLEPAPDGHRTHLMAQRAQGADQLGQALGRPAQRARRVAARRRIDELLEIDQQRRILAGQRRTARPRPPLATLRDCAAATQLLDAGLHRRPRHPRRHRDMAHPSVADGQRLRTSPSPTRAFVHKPSEGLPLPPHPVDLVLALKHLSMILQPDKSCIRYFGKGAKQPTG